MTRKNQEIKKEADPNIQSQVLSERDTAIYIGMSRSYLRQDRVDGPHGNRTPGPPFIRVGRRILYRRSELDDWLENHLVRHEMPLLFFGSLRYRL